MKRAQENKKIIFVNLSIDCGYNGVNHGIATLVPIARDFSYDVECLDIKNEISTDEFVAIILKATPSIVGYSTTSHQVQFLIKYSKALKAKSDKLQIAGGVGATLDWKIILKESSVSRCCIGEGEKPFTDFLRLHTNKKNFKGAEGFYWNNNGQIDKGLIPSVVKDLSTLAFPDYSVFERDVVVDDGTLKIMLTRGCPFKCSYCCNEALSSIYPTGEGYFRIPPVYYCIGLIKEIVRQYPETTVIQFDDDLLIGNKGWFIDFSKRYKDEVGLPYQILVRVESVSKEIIDAMKESGCVRASLGLESGNEKVRKKILKRKYTNDMLLEKCRMIKDSGIYLFTFNIVGFPLETVEEMKETFEINKLISPESGVCSFFHPYRNTALYEITKKNNLLKNSSGLIENTNYNTCPGIKMPRELERACIAINLEMTKYFSRQKWLAQLDGLPKGFKKYPLFCFYWGRYISQTYPFVKKILIGSGAKYFAKKVLGRIPKRVVS